VNKLERESQIKEAFWNAVHKQHSQFVDQVIQLMRAILEKQGTLMIVTIDPQFEFNGRTDPAITFIYVESKLTNHIR
jgi:predicted secreted protein